MSEPRSYRRSQATTILDGLGSVSIQPAKAKGEKAPKVNPLVAKVTLPKINADGKATDLTLGKLTVHYSYETVIGFTLDGKSTARINVWGNTTGQHLSGVDGGNAKAREARLNEADFKVAFYNALKAALGKKAADLLTAD